MLWSVKSGQSADDFLCRKWGRIQLFFASLPLSLCDYQQVSGEVLVSVNVMGRCFLWQVCLLLIRAHPSAGPPWSKEEGTGQICLAVHTNLSYWKGGHKRPTPWSSTPDNTVWYLIPWSCIFTAKMIHTFKFGSQFKCVHNKQCWNLSQDFFFKHNLIHFQVTLNNDWFVRPTYRCLYFKLHVSEPCALPLLLGRFYSGKQLPEGLQRSEWLLFPCCRHNPSSAAACRHR